MQQAKASKRPIRKKSAKSEHPGKFNPAIVEEESVYKAIAIIKEVAEEYERMKRKSMISSSDGPNNKDHEVEHAGEKKT